LWDRDESCQVENQFHIACGGFDRLCIPQITFPYFQVTLKRFKVFTLPGRKVIQDAHGSTPVQEFFHDMGPYESGSAGDKDTHLVIFPGSQ
jgi:hypothetical protein